MKPIRTEIPFATPWFEVVAKTYQEEESAWYSLRLSDYAATVALTTDGRVVLVRQFRPAVDKFTLELPSGLVDPGETPEAAAFREMREESGYECEIEMLGPLLPDSGRLANRIWCAVGRNARAVADWKPEPGIEAVLLTPAELAQATASGEFDHALHLAAVHLAVVRGKFPPY